MPDINIEINSLEVWKIDNSDLSYRYERRTRNLLKLACWTPASNDNEVNSVESICLNGFVVPPNKSGLEFSTGVVDIARARSRGEFNSVYSFIYSEIGVGRAYVCDSSSVDIPAGFDSLYITPQPLGRKRDGKFSLLEYRNAARIENRPPS